MIARDMSRRPGGVERVRVGVSGYRAGHAGGDHANEQTGGTMGRTVPVATRRQSLPAGLAVIEQLTATYADRRTVVVTRMLQLDSELQAIKKKRIGAIRKAVADANDARAELAEAIEAHKSDFEKPKTRIFHGIKVGFRKLIGKLTWEDGDQVVTLIKKHFSEDEQDLLIKTTESPVKAALEQLPAVELKKLGVSVGEDTDELVISATNSDVDKLVDALLKESDEGG